MVYQTSSPEPGRNELCPCGSKLKYKWCHGDKSKRVIANRVANLKMMELVQLEQKKRGIIPWRYKCENCGYGFDEPKLSSVGSGMFNLCPKCDSPNIIENETESEEEN